MLRNDDDWVKKCIEDEAESPRPRGRPKRTWREVVEKDCQLSSTQIEQGGCYRSHARTVVRECCKGDDESQWERVKFDPPPPKNPLTDGHQNLHT